MRPVATGAQDTDLPAADPAEPALTDTLLKSAAEYANVHIRPLVCAPLFVSETGSDTGLPGCPVADPKESAAV